MGPNRGLHRADSVLTHTFTRMNTCVSCDPQETWERAGFAPFCRKMRKLARPRASGCAGSQGRGGSVPSASVGGPCRCLPSSAPVPTQPKAAAASRGLCGAAGSVPGPAGTMGTACSRHPGPGRVGVGRSRDLESCKLETSVSEPRGSGLRTGHGSASVVLEALVE